MSATRFLLMLMLAIALGACGEARIVQRDEYVPINSHRPSHREAASRPIAGGEYVVVRGDTLYGVAFRNGMDFRELAAINGIQPPYTIYLGQLLRLRGEHVRPTPRLPIAAAAPAMPSIAPPLHSVRVEPLPESRPVPPTATSSNASPSARIPLPPKLSTPAAGPTPASPSPMVALPNPVPNARTPVAAAPPPVASIPVPSPRPLPATTRPAAPSASPIPTESAPADSAPAGGIGWRWPVKGSVIDRFMAGDATRQGVDIAGNAGDPVLAAADGVVVYSGSGLVGYGELIIIKHSDEWLSAYGHNRKRLVAESQRVKAGQQIAEMGRTGASRDMLHFEIRRNGRPVDPQQYLPQR